MADCQEASTGRQGGAEVWPRPGAAPPAEGTAGATAPGRDRPAGDSTTAVQVIEFKLKTNIIKD